MEIAGRTAFVTGAASGIGLAIARSLAGHGARVAMADLAADALAREAAALGDTAIPITLDVTDRAGWADARAAVEARFGGVSILVNNAGIGPDLHPIDAISEASFDRLVGIKLTGTYNGIRAFVPAMRKAGEGHIVNTASMAGLIASARLGAYTASKFAVVGMSEVLRPELTDEGIGVSVLCPGLVSTNLGTSTGRKPMTGGIDPAIVGEMVVEGICENHMHIVTHAEYRGIVEQRMQRVLAAFDRAATRNAEYLPGSDIARN
jgi:NAD(P)-dependent dehydrogenase (short-subunit alcohol dehydrogenase family)